MANMCKCVFELCFQLLDTYPEAERLDHPTLDVLRNSHTGLHSDTTVIQVYRGSIIEVSRFSQPNLGTIYP